MNRVMLALIAALVGLLLAQVALAHSWYAPECCSGQDCAPIPAEAVTQTADGWIIELREGDHPIASGSFFVRHGSPAIRPSQDGDYHVCILPPIYDSAGVSDPVVRCFHIPLFI